MSDSAARKLHKLHAGATEFSDAHGGAPEFSRAEIAQAAAEMSHSIAYPLVMLLHAGCDDLRELLVTRLSLYCYLTWYEIHPDQAIKPKAAGKVAELAVAEKESLDLHNRLTYKDRARFCGVGDHQWASRYKRLHGDALMVLNNAETNGLKQFRRALKDYGE